MPRPELTDSSEPSTSPAKTMWTTCFVGQRAAGRDRVDQGDRASTGAYDPDLLPARDRARRSRPRRMDAAAGQEPDVPARFAMAEQDPVAPAQERRDLIRGSAPIMGDQ